MLSFEPRQVGEAGYGMALLDLVAKAIGWPLYRIYGGREQDSMAVDYWIARMSAEDSAAAAQRALDLGFHGIKMKCKWEDGNMADRTFAIHAVAPEMRIVLDPNERFYNVENTLSLARELEDLDVIFEDPMPKDDSWQEYRRMKEESGVLICPPLQNPRQVIATVAPHAVGLAFSRDGPHRRSLRHSGMAGQQRRQRALRRLPAPRPPWPRQLHPGQRPVRQLRPRAQPTAGTPRGRRPHHGDGEAGDRRRDRRGGGGTLSGRHPVISIRYPIRHFLVERGAADDSCRG